MCLKESFVPECQKVASVVPIFKNLGERLAPKNCLTVSLLSVVSKVFEQFVKNKLVDH